MRFVLSRQDLSPDKWSRIIDAPNVEEAIKQTGFKQESRFEILDGEKGETHLSLGLIDGEGKKYDLKRVFPDPHSNEP